MYEDIRVIVVKSGSNRVLRGGSWNNNATSCRVAARGNLSVASRNLDFGMRLAL